MNSLNSCQEEIPIFLKDPRRFDGDVMNKTALEFNKLNYSAKLLLSSITCPLLALHGKDDQVTLSKGTQYVINQIGTISTQKKQVKWKKTYYCLYSRGYDWA